MSKLTKEQKEILANQRKLQQERNANIANKYGKSNMSQVSNYINQSKRTRRGG